MNLVVETLVFSTFTSWGLFSFFYFLFFACTKSTMQNKQFSLSWKFLCSLLVGFGLWRVFVFFVFPKSFCKKNKEFKTALITSFTLLLIEKFLALARKELHQWINLSDYCKFFQKISKWERTHWICLLNKQII